MTSERQFAANRRNSLKSSGPKTKNGKLRSRRNALQHGMGAETVVGVLEDHRDYKKFESDVIADYSPCGFVEYELVVRLASLFWRLRRATSIETGLLNIQGEIIRERRASCGSSREAQNVIYHLLKGRNHSDENPSIWSDSSVDKSANEGLAANSLRTNNSINNTDTTDIARCFLRLSNINNDLSDRLGRYEALLWRQVRQLLGALQETKRRSKTMPYLRDDVIHSASFRHAHEVR